MKKIHLPSWADYLILIGAIVFLTWQPYYLHGSHNTVELGFYLPGIQALLHGLVPYREFLHLRGPFELYLPAFLMMIFGKNIAVLLTYFYVGNVLTLIATFLIAKELFPKRWPLYLFVPVIVARTFPRVVYTYWGGMRYVWGLLVVLYLVRYFRYKRLTFLLFAGFLTSIAFWTSAEIGFCAGMMVLLTLIFTSFGRDDEGTWQKIIAIGYFFAGFLIVSLPYIIYFSLTRASGPFLDNLYVILTRLNQTFPQVEEVPRNLFDLILSMVNPARKNFRHVTPVYVFLAAAVYLFVRVKSKRWQTADSCLLSVWFYGALLYGTSFRNLWAAQFEMALQPEKLILFYLMYRLVEYLCPFIGTFKQRLQNKSAPLFLRWRCGIYLGCIYFYFASIVLSSLIYPFQRFAKRFYSTQYLLYLLTGRDVEQLKPLHDHYTEPLTMPTAKGLIVPGVEAQQYHKLYQFVQENVAEDESIIFYPEMGMFYFLVDRPFIGRFPMPTLTWFSDDWHKEYLQALKETRPRYAVIPKALPDYFKKTHFIVEANEKKYQEVMFFIETHYQPIKETYFFVILEDL